MNKLLVIVGPTGTGKTKLGLELAKKFNGEIVSADSRQLYREMDIATGKEVSALKTGHAKKEKGYWEVDGVKIHLYDLLSPEERFSVADYQQKALEVINNIQKEGKLPILVGGTGLYVQAITEGLSIPKVPPDLALRKSLRKTPPLELYEKLKEVDPVTALRIDQNNPHRLQRALEVYYQTGQSISSLKAKFKVNFDLLFLGLTASRDILYQNSDSGVDNWLQLGLVGETEALLKKGYSVSLPAMTSIGYRQIGMFLENKLTLAEAVQRIKFDIHSYIRRQLTWFKRDNRIWWSDISSADYKSEVGKLVGEWYNRKEDETT